MTEPEGTTAERDFSHETRVAPSRWRRWAWIAAGHLCVALALAGVLLPLLPTTPFLLLAAVCYARGSVRFYNWLMNHPWFGGPIRRWRDTRTISRRAKATAFLLVALTVGPTIIFVVPLWPIKIAMTAAALVGMLIMLRIPSDRAPAPPDPVSPY